MIDTSSLSDREKQIFALGHAEGRKDAFLSFEESMRTLFVYERNRDAFTEISDMLMNRSFDDAEEAINNLISTIPDLDSHPEVIQMQTLLSFLKGE